MWARARTRTERALLDAFTTYDSPRRLEEIAASLGRKSGCSGNILKPPIQAGLQRLKRKGKAVFYDGYPDGWHVPNWQEFLAARRIAALDDKVEFIGSVAKLPVNHFRTDRELWSAVHCLASDYDGPKYLKATFQFKHVPESEFDDLIADQSWNGRLYLERGEDWDRTTFETYPTVRGVMFTDERDAQVFKLTFPALFEK